MPVGADAADFVGHPVECIGYQYEIVDIAFPQVEADQPFERPDPHHPLRIVVDAADAQVVEQPQRVVVRMVFHETFRHGVVEVEPLLVPIHNSPVRVRCMQLMNEALTDVESPGL